MKCRGQAGYGLTFDQLRKYYNTIKLYLMIGISGNANNTANAAVRGSNSELKSLKTSADGTTLGGTASLQPQGMMNHYPSADQGKDSYIKVIGGGPGNTSSLTSSSMPVNNLGESTTTASSSSHQNMSTSLKGSSGNKSKRQEEKEKLQFNETGSSKTAEQTLIDTFGTGEDTSTSNSKKPQFQFVCMEPTKDQRQEKAFKIANQPKADKSASLIDPATLSRIIRLQKQQQFIMKSQMNGGIQSAFFGHSPNLMGNGSSIGMQRIVYSDKSSDFSTFASGAGAFRDRPVRLDIDKIGICGVPSLWVSRDELINQGQLFREQLDEGERLERFLRILLCHKKYENDKYFGGSIFKRGNHQSGGVAQGFSNTIMNGGNLMNHSGNQAQSTVSLGMGLGNQPEYIWFSLENLAKLKINAQTANTMGDDKEQVFPQIKSFDQAEALTFKILQAEAKLVRLILESHGFVQTEQNDWNVLWTCTSSMQKQYIYENLQEYQRINHFLNAAELTRKDRLCFNVGKMQQKFGKENFDFLPETYILPDGYPEFEKQFKLRAAQQRDQGMDGEFSKNLWIVKPSSSSQGKGIYMIDDLSELQMNESQVISRYIDNPLLINGLKFDLRLYVLVTNFDPLKVYVYNEGLVRFASEPYNLETIKSNVYAHLTNYSINKKSENFVQNKNLSERDFGNKWSLSALQSHLERLGIDMKAVWQRIYDAIIKSIISVEGQVVGAIKRAQNASGGTIKSNCFDLFGFDIILDQDLKPWILEVNLSPSLAFDSPLDFHIKSNLIIDALNVVGIRKFNRNKDGKRGGANGGVKPVKPIQTTHTQVAQQPSNQNSAQKGMDTQTDQRKRLSAHSSTLANMQSQSQLAKFDSHSLEKHHSNHQTSSNLFHNVNIDIIHMERLSKISAKHRELLREHLEEFCLMRQFVNIPGSLAKSRRHSFTRIFPAPGTNAYDVYFSSENSGQSQPQKQYNKILYRYLYDKSSELQDILSQIVRQNDLLNESQRRSSQTKMNGHQSALRTRDQLSDSLDRIEKGDFFEKSPERMGNHQASYGNTIDAGGVFGGPPPTVSTTKVVVTSVSVEQANVNQAGFNKQPRSQSTIAAPINIKSDLDIENAANSTNTNLKTIIVNNSSQLSTFSPSKENRRTAGVLQNSIQIENANLQTSPTKVNDYFSTQANGLLSGSPDNPGDMSPLKYIQASQSSIQSVEPFTLTQSKLSSVTSKDVSASKHTPKDTSQRRSHLETQGSNQNSVSTSSQHQTAVIGDGRIIVTGDDILIEYVRRIMTLIKQCHQTGIEVSGAVVRKLELFIGHKIWQPKEERNKPQPPPLPGNGMANSTSSGALNQTSTMPMWQRIEKRFFEMGERKRRLFVKKNQSQQSNQSQEARKASSEALEKQFRGQEKQKADIVKDFSSNELELMLMQSNKNNPIEVVTLLLTLNPALIGGTPATTSSALIYNGMSSQGGYGGVLTKLEQEAAAKVRANDGSTVNHHHMVTNEKSFDSNNYISGKTGQHGSQIGQLRQSDDSSQHHTTSINHGHPQSSHSSKKEGFASTLGSHNLESMKQTQYPNGGSHANGSNPSLLNNFANATIGASNIKSAVSKSKNQGSFDRSDIAMQTGLILTSQQHSNKLGTILLQNQQNVKFPQIHNHQNPLASAAVTSTAGFHYHSNNSAAHGYATNGSHSSVSGPATTSGTGNYPSHSFIPSSTQKPVGIHSYLASQHQSISTIAGGGGSTGGMIKSNTTTAGVASSSVLTGGGNAAGVGANAINNNNINNHGDGGGHPSVATASKYRVNKIQQQQAVSMSPGGPSGSQQQQQYMLNKNLRASTNNDHLNNIGSGQGSATTGTSTKNEIVMIKGPTTAAGAAVGASGMTSAVSLNTMLKGTTLPN